MKDFLLVSVKKLSVSVEACDKEIFVLTKKCSVLSVLLAWDAKCCSDYYLFGNLI